MKEREMVKRFVSRFWQTRGILEAVGHFKYGPRYFYADDHELKLHGFMGGDGVSVFERREDAVAAVVKKAKARARKLRAELLIVDAIASGTVKP